MVNNRSQKILLVTNGDKAWVSADGQTKDFPDKDLPFLKDLLYSVRLPQLLSSLRDKDFKLGLLGEVNVKDQPAVGLTVAHKDHKDVSLFFDKKDGRPVKAEVRLTTPGGKDITVEAFYAEYKEFDGVRHPTRMTFMADGKEVALELTEVRALDKHDDSIFAQP
jgi:zinc protease